MLMLSLQKSMLHREQKVYVPSMHVEIVEEKQALRTCGARQA